ncbi:MAG: hypothetical protein DCC71_00725 [Proteobacteria bacterium]|nr:MAG: hypothetical protein DCC71_00725 [Pseudomonadota bacterium]
MRRWMILGWLCLAAAPAHAAEPASIAIGTTSVHIGAAEKDVLPALREQFDVEPIREHLYQVVDKKDKSAVAGIVEVREGKVTFASRDLGAFEGEGVKSFGKALFKAVDDAKEAGEQPIHIDTQIEQNQTYALKMITLTFPGRRIVLYLGADGGAVDASMEEILTREEDAVPQRARQAASEAPKPKSEAK